MDDKDGNSSNLSKHGAETHQILPEQRLTVKIWRLAVIDPTGVYAGGSYNVDYQREVQETEGFLNPRGWRCGNDLVSFL